MDRDDPEQAADRHARAAVMGIFAVTFYAEFLANGRPTRIGLQTSRSGWVLLWTVIFVSSGNRHLEKIPQPGEFNDLLD